MLEVADEGPEAAIGQTLGQALRHIGSHSQSWTTQPEGESFAQEENALINSRITTPAVSDPDQAK